MSIEEAVIVTNEKTVEPQVEEVVKAEPTEEKTVETPEEEQPKTEDKKPEGDSSVIRSMRRQLKLQQKQISELRQLQVQPEPQPMRENFQNDSDYVKAEVAYQVKKIAPTASIEDPFIAKFENAKKTHDDFDETAIDHVDFADNAGALRKAVGTLQYGDELLYHLTKNPEEAEELSILPPEIFAVRLGEIHGDIRRSKVEKPKQSRAPAPITPVSGNTKIDRSYDEMSQEEFEAQRRKERSAHRLRYVTK